LRPPPKQQKPAAGEHLGQSFAGSNSVPCPTVNDHRGTRAMLNDREKILTALREKPLKIYEVMKRVNLPNEEACQSLLMKMRDEGLVKFDIHKGRWQIG
jgi:hypothetical protein